MIVCSSAGSQWHAGDPSHDRMQNHEHRFCRGQAMPLRPSTGGTRPRDAWYREDRLAQPRALIDPDRNPKLNLNLSSSLTLTQGASMRQSGEGEERGEGRGEERRGPR